MTTENQDPQKPTEDQPPPKQYAGQSSRASGERGIGERKPKIPNQVESSEGDDENSTAAEQNADYSHSAIPRTDDDLVTGPGQGGGSSDPKERSKQGGQAGRERATGAGERGSSGASGSSSSHSDRNR
jgi:hypothetical protein